MGDDLAYRAVARPLYKLGEKLAKEKPEQSAKRHEADASQIDAGKTIVKDSSWPKRRAKENWTEVKAGRKDR